MKKRRMLQHRWEPRPGVLPAVYSATELTGSYPGRITRHRTERWSVDYEFGAFGRMRVDATRARWRARKPNSVHLYSPDSQWFEDSRGETGQRHTAWIFFEGGEEAGLRRLIDPDYGLMHTRDPGGRAGACFKRAAAVGAEYGEQGFWQAQAALSEIIDLLLRAEHVEEDVYRIPAVEAGQTRSLSETVQTYLCLNLDQKIRLPEIARHVGVSLSTLAHRYPREAGETVTRTLARLRVEHAKALLLRGQPLKLVADQLGFSDPFHLSKTFKRIEGVAPRTFLNKHIKSPT